MNHYEAIRIKALAAVIRPNKDYLLRKIIRWYASTYNVDIRVVEGELPLDVVLQAYYEERYAEMTPEEREQEREHLLKPEEERYRDMMEEDADEADSFEIQRMIEAEERTRHRKKQAAKKRAAEKTAQKIAETQDPGGPLVPLDEPESSEPPQPMPQELPPAISMEFVSQEEFEVDLEGLGAMNQPQKP